VLIILKDLLSSLSKLHLRYYATNKNKKEKFALLVIHTLLSFSFNVLYTS